MFLLFLINDPIILTTSLDLYKDCFVIIWKEQEKEFIQNVFNRKLKAFGSLFVWEVGTRIFKTFTKENQ